MSQLTVRDLWILGVRCNVRLLVWVRKVTQNVIVQKYLNWYTKITKVCKKGKKGVDIPETV